MKNRQLNEQVILTGDNFEIPAVGLRGIVVQIDQKGRVGVLWETGKYGWFSKYQSEKWMCSAQQVPQTRPVTAIRAV